MARTSIADITTQLEAAITAGRIWNVDYVAIKDALGRHFDDVDTAVQDAVHGAMSRDQAWDLTSDFICSNYSNFAGRVARLEKQLADAPEALAAVQALVGPFLAIIPLVVAVKPLIVKGRKPTENPSLNTRTLEHTGTCGCCNRNIKLTVGGRIWDHGYEVEGRGHGYGYKIGGSCFGVGYEPIEVSSKVWVAMQADLERKLVALPERIANLTARLTGMAKPVNKGTWQMTPEEKEVAQAYHDVKEGLSHDQLCLKFYPERIAELKVSIATWTARPLPGNL
jgi:hypothetical protein